MMGPWPETIETKDENVLAVRTLREDLEIEVLAGQTTYGALNRSTSPSKYPPGKAGSFTA